MSHSADACVIAVPTFILATRDSGYRGTPEAVAELIDNSLQAGAREIRVDIEADPAGAGIVITVADNGCGMDGPTLRQALRFGGSTRFNDRRGMGRYGMGLPNASLSQARRVEVTTWRDGQAPLHSHLDVDEIAAGTLPHVPMPQRCPELDNPNGWPNGSGTRVRWSKCDRLDHKRISTLVRKLAPFLGRVFRYFLWDGIVIRTNGDAVTAIDPLRIHPQAAIRGGRLFGEPLSYEVRVPGDSKSGATGLVTVTFAELPVHAWHDLPNDEKRRLGLLNGAGVSIVRAGREIDFGWFFLNGKRRENYDDWWRCEVRFDPVLDELFGLAHTKQQIRPGELITQLLSADMESVARALNGRVRQVHASLKARSQLSHVERIATQCDQRLTPLPRPLRQCEDAAAIARLAERHPVLHVTPGGERSGQLAYTIVEDRQSGTDLFSVLRDDGRLVVVVNIDHPFHKRTCQPLADSEDPRDRQILADLQLLLLAAARAAASESNRRRRQVMTEFLRRWSDTLTTFTHG